jgi:uncharacterized protein (TIGR03435 family)
VLRSGRYDLRNATILDFITTAYEVDRDTVLGGPSWLESKRYDLIAKAPAGATQDSVKEMLQALLADRFKLALHKDTKSQPGYALTVNGKHKLTESSGAGTGRCEPAPPSAPPVFSITVSCHSVTMQSFAQVLRAFGGGYLDGPVVDLTGLKGSWDFELTWSLRFQLGQAGADGITLPDALEKQLGLKAAQQNIPMPVLLIDSVQDKPTDNPSGVAENLPAPPPAEFDVADIKLVPPGTATPPTGRLQPGGRIDLQGFTLRMLMNVAWDLNDNQLLAGGPKWLDETRYTVLAKASDAVTETGNALGPAIDFDDLRLMLRALLVERFKLVTHYEDRSVNAYALLAANPKLTKADPASRTRWKEGAALNAKDPRENPTIGRLVSVQNMTMDQFAEVLPRIAPGYLRVPVSNETGLEGSWDFTFNFSTVELTRAPASPAPNGGAAVGGAPVASVPSGALSLFDALNKQLGLKLDQRKRNMPVLVIDHVEEKPTD